MQEFTSMIRATRVIDLSTLKAHRSAQDELIAMEARRRRLQEAVKQTQNQIRTQRAVKLPGFGCVTDVEAMHFARDAKRLEVGGGGSDRFGPIAEVGWRTRGRAR